VEAHRDKSEDFKLEIRKLQFEFPRHLSHG
jgi:hypothetical protein